MDAVGPILSGAAALGLYALAIALLVWASLHMMLAVHELGHAVAAWAMGFPVRLIEIGSGYELLRMPLGLTLVRWRLWPSRGVTMLYRPFALRRRARVPYILGGCAANILAIAALFLAMASGPEQKRFYLLVLIVGQLLGVLQVFYVRRQAATGFTPDGGALLAAARGGPVWDRDWVRAYRSSIRAEYRGTGRERATTLSAVALHAVHVGGADRSAYPGTPREDTDPLEPRRLREALLAKKGLTPAERAALLDALITDELIVNQGELALLDEWSSELIALLPKDPNANASRGAVLALLRRPEAKKHLGMDLGPEAGAFGLALQEAYLARAALNEGDVETARRHIALSRERWAEMKIEPEMPIIVAMEREIFGVGASAPRVSPETDEGDGR